MNEVTMMYAGPADQAPQMPPGAPLSMPAPAPNAPPKAPEPTPEMSFQGAVVIDAKGRKLSLRELSLEEELTLISAAGAENAGNGAYMRVLGFVSSVASIDGVPVPITNRRELQAAVKRVGRDGIAAVIAHLSRSPDDEDGDNSNDELALAKN